MTVVYIKRKLPLYPNFVRILSETGYLMVEIDIRKRNTSFAEVWPRGLPIRDWTTNRAEEPLLVTKVQEQVPIIQVASVINRIFRHIPGYRTQ